jgi:transposase
MASHKEANNMPEDTKPENHENTPALQILKQIRDDVIDPKKLDPEIRQDCVEHLWYVEGRSVAEIAQILNVSDKTIRRDKDVIRERSAKKLTPEDRSKILGELIEKLTFAHENITKLSRSKDGSLQEKSLAGYYAAKSIQEQVELLQSLGYFPSKPAQIEADIHYSQEEEASPAKLKEELARLEGIVNAKGIIDPKIAELIDTVKRQIALAEAKAGIKELKTRIEEIEKGQETA